MRIAIHWITKSDYTICTDNNEYWWETTEEDYKQISHKELFEIFIKERNEK